MTMTERNPEGVNDESGNRESEDVRNALYPSKAVPTGLNGRRCRIEMRSRIGPLRIVTVLLVCTCTMGNGPVRTRESLDLRS